MSFEVFPLQRSGSSHIVCEMGEYIEWNGGSLPRLSSSLPSWCALLCPQFPPLLPLPPCSAWSTNTAPPPPQHNSQSQECPRVPLSFTVADPSSTPLVPPLGWMPARHVCNVSHRCAHHCWTCVTRRMMMIPRKVSMKHTCDEGNCTTRDDAAGHCLRAGRRAVSI